MKKIDYTDPTTIMAFIAVVAADFASFFTLGFLIPGPGMVIGAYALLAILFAGFLLIFLIVPHMKHLLPKITLLLFFPTRVILAPIPLPILSFGLFLAIMMQNRFIEFAVSQAAIIGIGVATGGAGAVAGEAAEGAATTAETGAVAARGAQTAARGTQAARGAAVTERAGATTAGLQKPVAVETGTGTAAETAEEGLTRGQKVGRFAQRKIREIRDEDLGIDTSQEGEEEAEEPERLTDQNAGPEEETIDLRP